MPANGLNSPVIPRKVANPCCAFQAAKAEAALPALKAKATSRPLPNHLLLRGQIGRVGQLPTMRQSIGSDFQRKLHHHKPEHDMTAAQAIPQRPAISSSQTSRKILQDACGLGGTLTGVLRWAKRNFVSTEENWNSSIVADSLLPGRAN